MKKNITLPLVLSIFTFSVAGCGGGDDGVYDLGGNDNELEFSSFERNGNTITRLDIEYSNGERDSDRDIIIGNVTQTLEDLSVSTVLANNFEGTLNDDDIEVDGRTVKRPIYQKNSNTRFNYQTTYRTLNLSGIDANDYMAADTINNRRGIFTDLNNFTQIPSNSAFPTGSVCYIPVTTSERSFFVFNARHQTNYLNLDDWTTAAQNTFSDNRQSVTTTVNAGIENSQTATQVRFVATDMTPEYSYHGVDYNAVIYDANYVDSNQTSPNENGILGVVDCTLVNEVAADFLESEIKRYY